jgi:uracil-DNA glycosylase family 4
LRFNRNGISNCSKCPLRDRKRVWGEGPEEGPIHQAFLGEAPGEQEDLKGHPFVGPAGGLLSKGLTEAETERFRSWVFNLLPCRPSGNKLDSYEGELALSCCKPGFQAEIKFLEKRGLRVLTALGGKALPFLSIPTTISKARGSIYESPSKKFIIVPAYHPSFLLHGMQKEIPTWIADLQKAHDLSKKPYRKIGENFNLFPDLAELERFINDAIRNGKALGVDIETIGIRADRATIVVVGLASSSEEAISVPFFSRGMAPYWPEGEEVEARRLLQKGFSNCPLIFQNALFDILVLRQNGFHLSATDDVLLAHHAIHPELPHNLAYIVSIYGKTPYWKDDLKMREDVVRNMEDEVLRRYNLRDSVVLHQVLPDLEKDLKIMGTMDIYKKTSVPLIDVLLDATSYGITLDRPALEAWKRSLKKKVRRLEKGIFEEFSLPSSFMLSSGDHLRLFIFGYKSNQFIKAEEERKAYDDPSRKKPLRRDTKKFKEIEELIEVSRKTPFLWPAINNHQKRKTDSGKLSTDETSLLSIQLDAIKRRDLIENFAKQDEEDKEELKLVKKTISFIEQFRVYSETQKLLSTYTDFPTWKDGKVHPSFMIHGTKTGRLSSRDPNGQNIPSEARKVFKARPNCIFIEGDYSNLEPRILAYVSGDIESIKTFEEGKNIHDQNTIALFPEATKEDPDWKLMRMAAKKYRLAMNYGGGLYSVYQKVCLEVPGLNLSFPQFKEADSNYTSKHPQETKWLLETADEAVEKRQLRNIFGRIRIFLGTESEIRREGVNFPIQSAGADIISPAMISLHSSFKKWKGKNPPHLLLQVHDSLLVECLASDKKKVISLMKAAMERTIKVGKRTVSFPIEFKVGTNWGEMKELK